MSFRGCNSSACAVKYERPLRLWDQSSLLVHLTKRSSSRRRCPAHSSSPMNNAHPIRQAARLLLAGSFRLAIFFAGCHQGWLILASAPDTPFSMAGYEPAAIGAGLIWCIRRAGCPARWSCNSSAALITDLSSDTLSMCPAIIKCTGAPRAKTPKMECRVSMRPVPDGDNLPIHRRAFSVPLSSL